MQAKTIDTIDNETTSLEVPPTHAVPPKTFINQEKTLLNTVHLAPVKQPPNSQNNELLVTAQPQEIEASAEGLPLAHHKIEHSATADPVPPQGNESSIASQPLALKEKELSKHPIASQENDPTFVLTGPSSTTTQPLASLEEEPAQPSLTATQPLNSGPAAILQQSAQPPHNQETSTTKIKDGMPVSDVVNHSKENGEDIEENAKSLSQSHSNSVSTDDQVGNF